MNTTGVRIERRPIPLFPLIVLTLAALGVGALTAFLALGPQ